MHQTASQRQQNGQGDLWNSAQDEIGLSCSGPSCVIAGAEAL